MKVINEIKPMEINGENSMKVGDDRILIVESHWNWKDKVHLRFGDINLLVSVRELRDAITNAENH